MAFLRDGLPTGWITEDVENQGYGIPFGWITGIMPLVKEGCSSNEARFLRDEIPIGWITKNMGFQWDGLPKGLDY